METQTQEKKPIETIRIDPSKLSPKEFIEIIQLISAHKFKLPDNLWMYEQGRCLQRYETTDQYGLVHEHETKNQQGQRHVETYHHEDDLITLLLQGEKILEYSSSQEWEYTNDGYDPKTEDTGVVRMYEEDPLARKVLEEVEAITHAAKIRSEKYRSGNF